MKEGPAELSDAVYKCQPCPKAPWAHTRTQEHRALVLKRDKAIIDLPDSQSCAKKARGTAERGVERGRRGQGQVSRGVGPNPNSPDAKSLRFGKLGLACKNKQKNTAGLAALSLIKQYLRGFEVWRSLGSSASRFYLPGLKYSILLFCFSTSAKGLSNELNILKGVGRNLGSVHGKDLFREALEAVFRCCIQSLSCPAPSSLCSFPVGSASIFPLRMLRENFFCLENRLPKPVYKHGDFSLLGGGGWTGKKIQKAGFRGC